MSPIQHEFVLAMPILSKLLLGAVLGALIGLEREAHGRPAGLRTHMLIVLGVVLFCEVSKAFSGADASRIAANVVTGIGFIGAGTILRQGAEIKGLTSAASIWAAAGVGMAISTGGPFILVSVLSTGLILVTLAFVSQVERRFYPRPHRKVLMVRLVNRENLFTLIQSFGDADIGIEGMRILDTEPLELALELTGSADNALPLASVLDGVAEVKWI